MTAIELNYREYGRGETTLVILHGLLGSSQNWQRVAKTLSERFHVIAIDQRNHGESPHTATHTFDDLREDVYRFLERHRLDQIYLLGHSMGGLAAMEFAFYHPERLHGLIVEDIAPRAYQSASLDILKALLEIPLEEIASRKQAEAELAKTIDDVTTRQFLLTNLVRNDDQAFRWRANLPILLEFQNEMAQYEAPIQARYTGETLFIGGERSPYRIDQDHDLVFHHFPNSHLEMIPNAGHWLHFEVMERFNEVIIRFIDIGLKTFS